MEKDKNKKKTPPSFFRRKLRLIIIVVVILLLLAIAGTAGAAFVLSNNEKLAITLVKESGTVMYKMPDKSDYTELQAVEIELPNGSYVKTEAESYARVFLPDNSLISIDQSSEIQLHVDRDEVSIDQFVGRTWSRVQTVGKGGQYEVKTPNAIAAVRGTIFAVDAVNDNLSRIYVKESTVELSRYEEDDENITILETILLNADEFAIVVRDDASFRIEKLTVPEDFKNDFWFFRNLIIDEEYKKLEGKDGKKLREQLLLALQNQPQYGEFLFGLTPKDETDDENIKQQLKQVEDITKVSEETCKNYSLKDIQLAIDKVNVYHEHITNYEDISELLALIKDSCEDGSLSTDEIEVLRGLIDSINHAIQ